MEIYLHQDGERAGPFTLENIQGQLEGGQLTVSDAAWFEGCSDWVTVQDVPGIMLPGGDHLVEVATVPPFDAYHGDEPYVFVSYAHKDAAVVYEEITRLHETDCNLWYDEGIEASNEWPEEIANAVIHCSVFLVFVSPRATASVNCRNEINLALNENKPFLAIYLEETGLPPGLRLRMGDLQAILRYKLPVDRYQKKTQDSLDQLLGKKPAKKQKSSHGAQATISSKPRRKGLAVALASILLIACCVLGYLFLGDDGDDGEEATETSTATFTPGEPWTVPSVSIEMLWCEPGTFMMGSPENEESRGDNETQRKVTLTKGFYLGKCEVTQAQWTKVMGTNPSKSKGDDFPVETVSWTDAMNFCQKLTQRERDGGRMPEGWEYMLPMEAQWEYACRAGTTTAYAFGDKITAKQVNFDKAVGKTTVVGKYLSNDWGFHDMHGNVVEWCLDRDGDYPRGDVYDPVDPSVGTLRVYRGGGWNNDSQRMRSAKRSSKTPDWRGYALGFRLSLQQTQAPTVAEQAKFPTPGKPWTVPTGSMDMIWCEPGTFMMGSPESELGRGANETLHEVTLTQGFWLGKCEVTQAQWNKVHKEKHPGAGNLPLEHINWWRVMEFCQNFTIKERNALRIPRGWKYTLPTEAQWEYACRAGTTTAFAFGNTLSTQQANVDKAVRKTTVVGNYPPNAWGFHDMHGNVSEWCSDWYGKYPQDSVSDPLGRKGGGERVFRGGNWQSSIKSARLAHRKKAFIGKRDHSLGFRLSLQKAQPPKAPGQPTPGKPRIVPSCDLEMLWCEPGTFIMGSPESEEGRQPGETEHEVTLTKGFYLGKYEVTQAQYQVLMTGNEDGLSVTPSEFNATENGNRPVEQVSWNDAQVFCARLTKQEQTAGRLPTGWAYLLPTESEWEYACRAGTTTVFSWGNDVNSSQTNYSRSGISRTQDVGQYPANPWGFHDMHGNVWEWAADFFDATYPAGQVTDPTGPFQQKGYRVKRGGSWKDGGTLLRSAKRWHNQASTRKSEMGFRVALRQVGK